MSQPLFPVVILAGGLATRLRPVTAVIPKSLLAVHGEPFIYHQLRLLRQKGIRDVILCVGYLGDQIKQQVGSGASFDLHVRYSDDGEILLGTGGAIKKALPFVGDRFFVLYGDSYLDCDYAAVQTAFIESKQLGLMTVFRNEGQWDNSNIEYEHGCILAYDKQQRTERMHYIDYGLGIFDARAFSFVPENTAYDLAHLYQTLLAKHQLAAYEVRQRFYETGSFAGIAELEYYLSGN